MFHAELVDLKSNSKVGYVPSKLASQMTDDDWASERQIMPMCTGEVTILREVVDAEEGSDGIARVVSVDRNLVELNDPTDLVIAPMDDTEMANFLGIPVVDEDKEEKDGESSMPTDIDATRDRTEDVDGQLMEDDAHDDELVNVYDKENPVVAMGKVFPNMDEFRMCFKTYAVKHEFDAKTKWTDRKKFYARCRDFYGSFDPCKWYISARRQPYGSTIRVNQIPHQHTCITSSQRVSTMTSQLWIAEKITPLLAKKSNTTAKKLKVDLEKEISH
ncbi:hypothetical protein D1007_04691 [Hordeum vulgare]|nr:hypothetical protein D1007_04691 [Hordeum vulgare]